MQHFLRNAALAAATLASAAFAADGQLKVATGVDFSSGDYGDTVDTDMLYVPAIVSYKAFPFTAKLTVPYLRIEGPGNVVGGVDGGGVVVGDAAGETTTESGLGDVIVAGMYSLDPWSDSAPFVDFTAKVKLPTADDEKRLGTGAADYTLQVDVAKSFGDWMPFVTLGYQFMGQPDDYDLDDRAFASVGTDVKLTGKVSAGGAYDFKQSSVDSSDDASEVMLYTTVRLSPAVGLNLYGAKGLSDGSPDVNYGAQVSRKF